MIRSDLPLVRLAELPGGPEPIVMTANAHLAMSLRKAHGDLQIARGVDTWRALQSSTPAMWLDHLTSTALLRGDIPPASVPDSFLSRAQERCLWEQAIARDAGAAEDLFDREGMALAAMDAASLQAWWRIEVPEALHTEEYLAYQRWSDDVRSACQAGRWRRADEVLAWRIECIERGIGGLPARLGIAGFVVPDPMVSRLLVVLEGRGVELFRVDFGSETATPACAVEMDDAEAECIAAARWARDRLHDNSIQKQTGGQIVAPHLRLRIAVADLPARRRLLEAALEDALHPQAVGAGWAALERDYVFVAGAPLASEPLVDVALRLLQLFVSPQRVAQAGFGALLCGPGWSADLDEADGRAQIEAELRERLPPETSLERLQRAISRLLAEDSAAPVVPRLMEHLTALHESARAASRRQLSSAWGSAFGQLLETLGWPGQRTLLPAEHEACVQLREAIGELQALDGILGRVAANDALRQLQRQCRDQSFAVARQSAARVEVCALGDALAGGVDGLWVMGLNEGTWPPGPRPNPILPAELQRRAGVADARADSLALEAQALQALWCASADEVVLSWARQEGERPLRASPLLAKIAQRDWPSASEKQTVDSDAALLELLDDARAPPVGEYEQIRGGTALLQAQAVCPAWGFYQYRLGAAVLPAPTFGLDARARGSLLHAALEEFWRGRALADLLKMDEAMRAAELRRVVTHALAEFDRRAAEPLPPRLRLLENERLQALLVVWLELEARRTSFRVIACEERHELDIEGLPVRVVVDRVDQLDDGRLVVIDYKSGRSVSVESWADARISEPQLPIYAALAFPDRAVAAAALARVTRDEPGFLGVAESAGLLPDVKSLDEQRKRYAEEAFPDWDALRQHWARCLKEVAGEVKNGVAAVVFKDEQALAYCDVRPLLRVAERRAQFDAVLDTGGAES
ncbi:MAG: PD-(D/E)XK nuclease family protein [Sulfuritalea sp.]|nr:PD-(D/E)XK nuclease family protein [Sulfuritalea sp.]